MAKTLYICYFGVREPLVQTQVLPYLRELMKVGIGEDAGSILPMDVSLLTFEPFREAENLAEFAVLREKLAAEGIAWEWLPYHKWPSAAATAWDILRGTIRVWRMHRRSVFDVFHCRVHVPALIGNLARKFLLNKPKVLFDVRGLFPEEYTDAGIWPRDGILFKIAKKIDKWLMRKSDGFVVLTDNARHLLFPESIVTGRDAFGRPVVTIPCCVDQKRFEGANDRTRSEVREAMGINGRNVAAYLGSFGGWYMSDEMYDFFEVARKLDKSTFLLILTQRNKEVVASRIKELGFDDRDVFVEGVEPNEVPRYLVAADYAVSFILPCYSKRGSSPTKVAEYLACGLPVVSNRGIGDIDELIEADSVGALLERFDDSSYELALQQIESLISDPGHRERCVASALERFDLVKVGGPRYREIYRKLLTRS
ncbi:MAG TPA: glycosyltransferase [Pyrinomonadaceae bacterium]|nr:glycosyltransferase [Pyrinomonadaceae bacterium]HRK48895.1 glycosyltransferase [Pyrinomonadaceae bacterium]